MRVREEEGVKKEEGDERMKGDERNKEKKWKVNERVCGSLPSLVCVCVGKSKGGV